MPDERLTDLHFPKAGLNVVSAFSSQPNRPVGPNNEYARTAPIAINVRGYSTVQQRFRGGSRSGLGKPTNLPATQVNGVTFVVQELAVLADIGASPYSSLVQNVVGYYKLDGDLTDSSGNGRDLHPDRPPDPTYGTGILNQDLTSGAGYVTPLGGLTDDAVSISAWLYTTSGTGGGAGSGFGRGTEVGAAYRIAYRANGAHGDIVVRDRTGTNVIDPGFTLAFNAWHHALLTYDGTTATLYVDGVSKGTYSNTLAAGWSSLTYGINATGTDFDSPIDEVGVWSHPLTVGDAVELYNAGTPPVLFGENVELSQSGRVVSLVAVSQGVVKIANPGDTDYTVTTNNTGETPPLNYTGVIYSAVNNQQLFFVDGINYCFYKPDTVSVELWSSFVTAGTLPTDADSNNCRLICTWRGRTCLSGLLKDPQNIFMSAVSDPFNWDYAPVSATPTQAVALNASPLGLVGDVVTALIPYTDDVLVIGTDHTIWLLRGDPMAGGQLDLVSDAIGIAWGMAWCKGPDGTLYFISNRCGFYSLVPGNQPVRISQPIEPLLQNLDMGMNLFRLAWDDQAQGFWLFITWVNEPKATTHYFFENRTQAWVQVKFANNNHNPLCCVTFDGNDPDDRQLLIGCWDAYVRKIDPNAPDDDGTPIASEVWIGPILTQDFDDILLKDLQAVLGETSGDVTYDVFVGPTAEKALESESVASGTWGAGRGPTNAVRRSGHAIYIRLTSTVQWAMEAIRARIVTSGKVRRRINVPPGAA